MIGENAAEGVGRCRQQGWSRSQAEQPIGGCILAGSIEPTITKSTYMPKLTSGACKRTSVLPRISTYGDAVDVRSSGGGRMRKYD